MGYKDLKTTMRYIRAVQVERDVRPIQFIQQIGHNKNGRR